MENSDAGPDPPNPSSTPTTCSNLSPLSAIISEKTRTSQLRFDLTQFHKFLTSEGTPTPEEINNFLNPVKVFQVCSEKIKSLESELERAKIDAKRQADENKAKILKLSKKSINQEYTIKSFKLSLSAKEKELKATEKKYEFAKKVMECVKNTSDLREKFLLDVVKNAEILSKTERDSLNSVKRSKVNLITEVIKLRKENNKLKSKISMSPGLKSITSKKQKEDQKTKLFDGKDLSNWSGSQIKPIIDETNVNF